jgi:hypothetical protein
VTINPGELRSTNEPVKMPCSRLQHRSIVVLGHEGMVITLSEWQHTSRRRSCP